MNSREYFKNLAPHKRKETDNQLLVYWTCHSTGLEGNSFTLEETAHFLLHGVTIKNKSSSEHLEIKAHANAIEAVNSLFINKDILTEDDVKALHKIVVPYVVDVYSPVGEYKNEPNGTLADPGQGKPAQFYYYPPPEAVRKMMPRWVNVYNQYSHLEDFSRDKALEIYADLFLKFVRIHPFADGNGRLGRILANIPLLQKGYPPVIIAKDNRQEYISLLNKVALPNENYKLENIFPAESLQDFTAFCKQSWQDTCIMLQELTKNHDEKE